MSEPPKKEYRFKVIVVGTGGVGKTSIIKRFVNNYFSKNYKATVRIFLALPTPLLPLFCLISGKARSDASWKFLQVGVDFALKVMDVGNDTRVHLQLWFASLCLPVSSRSVERKVLRPTFRLIFTLLAPVSTCMSSVLLGTPRV
jgi:tetraacyldisaccharide-1-P 4'-kinase